MSKKSSPRLKKTNSLESTGSLLNTNVSSRVSLASGVSADVSDDQTADIFSCSALLIQCVAHKVYAVVESGRKGVFLPIAALVGDGFQQAAKRKLRAVSNTNVSVVYSNVLISNTYSY